MSRIEELVDALIKALNDDIEIVTSAERINDEDHPVIGVELEDGEQFFVEVTLP